MLFPDAIQNTHTHTHTQVSTGARRCGHTIEHAWGEESDTHTQRRKIHPKLKLDLYDQDDVPAPDG